MCRIQGAWSGFRVHSVSIFVHQAIKLTMHTMLMDSFAESFIRMIPFLELLWLLMSGMFQTS